MIFNIGKVQVTVETFDLIKKQFKVELMIPLEGRNALFLNVEIDPNDRHPFYGTISLDEPKDA